MHHVFCLKFLLNQVEFVFAQIWGNTKWIFLQICLSYFLLCFWVGECVNVCMCLLLIVHGFAEAMSTTRQATSSPSVWNINAETRLAMPSQASWSLPIDFPSVCPTSSESREGSLLRARATLLLSEASYGQASSLIQPCWFLLRIWKGYRPLTVTLGASGGAERALGWRWIVRGWGRVSLCEL